jgi:hypothetical protein
MISGHKLDKRTLTNVQREAMGLSPRCSGGKRGPANSVEKQERERLALCDAIANGKISPPEVRLAEQFGEMIKKWADRGIGHTS